MQMSPKQPEDRPISLPGSPLQGAVGAHVEHHVRPEHLVHPAVKGQVGVGRGAVGAVVELLRPLRRRAHGLHPHKEAAVSDAGDDDLAPGHHHGARGGAPALLHLGPGLGVKTVEPPLILLRRHRGLRPLQRGLRGEPAVVVGHRRPDAGNDLRPAGKGVGCAQALALQGPHHPEYRLRRVQAVGAADGVAAGRHVVKDDGHLFLRHGLGGQFRPAAGQLRHPRHPVGQGRHTFRPSAVRSVTA